MKKIFVLFILLPFGLWAQSNFDQKKKEQIKSIKITGFEEIDGRNANRGLRQEQSFSPSFRLNEIPMYRTYKTVEDPTFIHIENLKTPNAYKNVKMSMQGKVFTFLETVKSELNVDVVSESFKITSIVKDTKGNEHIRLQQSLRGIPVYGGELVVHTRENEIKTLNGHLANLLKEVNTNAKLSETEAIEIGMKELSKETIVQNQGLAGGLLQMKKSETNLLLYDHEGVLKLAYEMVLRPNILERWVLFVDAVSGEVLDKYNHTCTIDGVFRTQAADLNGIQKSFVITQSNDNFFLIDPSKKMFNNTQSKLPNQPVGTIWTIDASNSRINDSNMKFSHVNSPDGRSWSATAVSAHANASACYDYYEKTFNRNSLNGSGGNIISVINIADEDGGGMDNAYWNGEFMGYGNGRDGFRPLAGALDVAGHEMTHGVIENTAKLEYRNQSGAMNESFADIFGAMIDRDDWTLGEDVVRRSVFPSGALRSLENPNQGGKNDRGYQPKTMSQYVFLRDIPSEDNGGVHVNSGITNYAFFLFATGSGMTKSKAEQVYYHTLNNYLTRTSKFVDLRLAVIQSTIDLYGNGQEVAAARSAFDRVGIVEPTSTGGGNPPNPTPKEEEIPVNPGDQFLVVYEPVGKDLYAGRANLESSFSQIAQNTGCKKKPSVTDDGSFVYWVGDDSNIYRKNLLTSASLQKISDNASWDNVAISKNGQLLAALSKSAEPFIYIFDLVNNRNVRFRLFNPTYTQGISTGEVLYADALEWDYSGEFLIYDAFNRASGLFGNIEYWDVGVLKAWDVATKTFTDGRDIQKIFSDLDEGDNIGNPAISKTNPNVIAFDYLNSIDGRIFILGANLSSGNLNVIVENNEIGFPDYSVDDNAMVYNSSLNNGVEVVKIIGLKADRISAQSTSGQRLFSSGEDKFAVYFAQGQRALPQKQVQTITFNPISDKNRGETFTLAATASSKEAVQFSLVSGDLQINANNAVAGNTSGKVTVKAFQVGNSNFTSVSSEQTFCIRPATPSITLNGNIAVAQGGNLYQWYLNGKPINGQTSNNTFNINQFSGLFNVQSITADGCTSLLSNGIANATPLSASDEDLLGFEIFPNPFTGSVSIKLDSDDKFESIEFWDITGKKVLTSRVLEVNTSQLPSGVYTINVKTKKGSMTRKLVKH